MPITNRQKAVIEQENAAYWAARARLYSLDLQTALRRGDSSLAGSFRLIAVSCQDYANNSACMARYHQGFDLIPIVL